MPEGIDQSFSHRQRGVSGVDFQTRKPKLPPACRAKPESVELQQSIAHHVQSGEQVEIRRASREDLNRVWSATELFREVQSSENRFPNVLKTDPAQHVPAHPLRNR